MINRKVTVPIVIALIIVIASIGFANAKPKANATTLQIVRMAYATSTEPDRTPTSDWMALPGNQFPVAHLTLDRNPATWYYLGADSFKSRVEVTTGYVYLFYLTPPEDPAFYEWWADKGVYKDCTGVWEPIMWSIISGEPYDLGPPYGPQPLHMFGFVPNWPMPPRQGLPKLIDSLQYYLYMLTGGAAGSPMADLRL